MLLYRGLIATDLSGRLDGIVWSHNRGGPYARNATTPTNPDTTEQQACREALATLKGIWNDQTDATRRSWLAYSQSAPRTNRIGIARPAGAWPEFTRANIIRQQANNLLSAGLDIQIVPPPWPTAAGEPLITASIADASAGEIDFVWPNTAPWVTASEQTGVCIWLSDHQPQTINFFRTPFTLVKYADGNNFPTGATAIMRAGQFPIPADRRVFWRCRTTYLNGLLGFPQTGFLDT